MIFILSLTFCTLNARNLKIAIKKEISLQNWNINYEQRTTAKRNDKRIYFVKLYELESMFESILKYILLPVAHKWKSFIETDKHVQSNMKFPNLKILYKRNYLNKYQIRGNSVIFLFDFAKRLRSDGLKYFRAL